MDRLYCGVNCRTRASRMRKRGVPVGPAASPTPISLVALLTEGMGCPCCGARIVLHTTAIQAGMPLGQTASASAGQTAGRDNFAAPAAPRFPASEVPRSHRRPKDPHPATEARQRNPKPAAPRPHAPAAPHRHLRNSQPPMAKAPRRTKRTAPTRRGKLPAGLFPSDAFPPSAHRDIAQYRAKLISVCSSDEMRGLPWPASDRVREGMVDNVLTVLKTTLASIQSESERQSLYEWTSKQLKTLLFVGARLTQTIQDLWSPQLVADDPAELAQQALNHVWNWFFDEYPNEREQADLWWPENHSLLLLIGAIIATNLSFANRPDDGSWQVPLGSRSSNAVTMEGDDEGAGNEDDEQESDEQESDEQESDEQESDTEEEDDEVEDDDDGGDDDDDDDGDDDGDDDDDDDDGD